MNKLLSDKVALITGASKGIGAAVAKRFAQEGAHVILVSRNVEELRQVDDEIKRLQDNDTKEPSTTLAQLDLLEFSKIKSFAELINAKFKAIDILVASAAVLGELCPVQDYDPEVWENVIGTNFNANWYLIKNFDPLLKCAGAGRAIFVTSDIGSPYGSKIDFNIWRYI